MILLVYKEGTDSVWLTIADNYDWQDEKRHMLLLQEKINTYLAFIENGELYKIYPEANGRNLSIEIYAGFPIPELGIKFLKKWTQLLSGLGMVLAISIIRQKMINREN